MTDEQDTPETFKINGKKLLGTGPTLPDFDDLLVNAVDIDERTKTLWLEIYRNACYDRERASTFVTDLIGVLNHHDISAHALHGQTAVKYLEKMGKANDQLLKLVEQMHAYTKKNEEINADDLLDSFQQDNKGK